MCYNCVMEYSLVFKKEAIKSLKKIPLGIRKQILDKLSLIAEDPSVDATKKHGLDIVKLDGFKELYRLRQGEYRVVYSKQDDKLTIVVIKAKSRGEVYK